MLAQVAGVQAPEQINGFPWERFTKTGISKTVDELEDAEFIITTSATG